MEYRHGKCRDCEAEYKVPATFQGDQAKCKKCGGTVEVGPVRKAAQPVPARKPAPQPAAKKPAPKPAQKKKDELVEHAPSGKKSSGPSMKEKLLAAREGASDAAPAAKDGVKAAAEAGRSARRSAAAGAAAVSAAGGVRRGVGAGSRSSARRAGGRRGKAGDDDEDAEEGAGRGRRQPQKKSPLPMIAIGVGVLLVGGAIWQFGFNDSGDEVAAADDDTASADAATTPLADNTTGNEDTTDGPDEDTSGDEAPEDDTADNAFADLPDLSAAGIRRYKAPSNRQITTPKKLRVSIPDDLSEVLQNQIAQANSAGTISTVKSKADYIIASGTITGADGTVLEVPENRVKDKLDELFQARDIADEHYVLDDPAEPKLATFEKFGAPEGTSDEEWDALQEAVETMMDPDAGAAGGRAQRLLEETGRAAMPAIINSLLDMNLGTEGGYLNGGVAYKALRNICNNQGFNWDYRFDDSPTKCTLENRRTVEKYYQVWEKVIGNPEYWWQFTKLEKDEDAASEDNATGAGADADIDDALDDLDDLDDF